MEDLRINENIIVPASALIFTFSRSGGKGGQNVNKVSTKVAVTLHLDALRAPDEVKQRLRENLSHRLDSSNKVRVVSQQSRSQWKNKQLALQKLAILLAEASREPAERIATSRTKVSHVERLTKKKRHSKQKLLRQKKNFIDE